MLSPGEAYSLICAFIWAVSVVLFTRASDLASPLALNLFKNLVGLLLYAATLPIIGVSWAPANASPSDWVIIAVSGIIGIGIADSIFFSALKRLRAGSTAIVESFYSPFVVLLAALTLGEPLSLTLLLAVGAMSAAVIVGTGVESSSGDSPAPNRVGERSRSYSIGLGILSVFLMAVGIVLVKPRLAQHSAWWVATIRLAAGTTWLLLQGLVSSKHRTEVLRVLRPSGHWKVLVPAGVIGCYLATITWVLGVQKTFASKASVLNQTSSLMVVLLAAVFLGEKLTWRKAAGVGLALVGTALITQA